MIPSMWKCKDIENLFDYVNLRPVGVHPPQISDYFTKLQNISDFDMFSPSSVMVNTIQPHLVVDLQKAALHQETAGAVASTGLCLSLNGAVEAYGNLKP